MVIVGIITVIIGLYGLVDAHCINPKHPLNITDGFTAQAVYGNFSAPR